MHLKVVQSLAFKLESQEGFSPHGPQNTSVQRRHMMGWPGLGNVCYVQ